MSKEAVFHVTGMHCVHCEEAVARALAPLPGLTQVRVSYRRGTVSAVWDEALVSREEIRQALQKADYDLAPERGSGRMGAALRALLLLLAALALYGAAHCLGLSRYLSAFPLARAGMGYGALLLLGLMTSLHCVAMCGGIGMAQSASAARGGRSILRANLLYNLGRVASYTLTGGLVGALGTVLSLSDGMKAAVQIVAAVFMLVMALNLLGEFPLLRRLSLSLPKGLHARLAGKGSSSLLLGLLNGLMPCGPLQAMQLYALSTGSAAQGALSMLLFSLGTVPLMLLTGLAAGRLRKSAASLLRMASALIVFVMGLNMLAQGLALSGVAVSLPAPSQSVPAADGIARLDGGVQRVTTEIDYGSYPPITVQAGVPVEWTIRVPEGKLTGCNNAIVIPAYGLRVELQTGDNLVAFTPEEPGTVAFSCWMGMIRSTITVVESLEAEAAASPTPEIQGPMPSPAPVAGCCL